MKLVVIAGMPGAGKEEFLTAGKTAGIPFARMGDAVRRYYSMSDAKEKGVSIGEFAGNERKVHGTDIWVRRTLEKTEKTGILMIDGCRSPDEIRSFEGLGHTVVTVGVYAPPGTRYDRLVKRARNDAPKDKSDFEARDKRELSWGVGEVLALCDRMLLNTGTLEEFHHTSAELLRSLL